MTAALPDLDGDRQVLVREVVQTDAGPWNGSTQGWGSCLPAMACGTQHQIDARHELCDIYRRQPNVPHM